MLAGYVIVVSDTIRLRTDCIALAFLPVRPPSWRSLATLADTADRPEIQRCWSRRRRVGSVFGFPPPGSRNSWAGSLDQAHCQPIADLSEAGEHVVAS